jgi:C_GCAxxG_C_C family probable redox protein
VGEHVLGTMDEQAIKMATAMGGGVGLSTSELCGALSGGAMVIGALHGRTQADADDGHCAALVAKYAERFRQELGSSNCGVLLAIGYGNEEEPTCLDLVQHAALLLLDVLEKD